MACSKIFSEGGLPELLSDIMQYFRNDFSTLHSYTLLISDCIEKWVAAAVNTHNSDFIKFIHKSLIKIFIESKANLYVFNVFEQLNVLDNNCYSLDSNFIQQIINLTKLFKLKSLFINRIFESIELLLQKSGDRLEDFGLSFELTYCEDSQQLELIKLITNYCTKIKCLELTGFNNNNNQIIYSTFNLIETIKQNFNYLTIDITDKLRLYIWF
ncbi:hypothetical protein C1646_771605 [Rhizophagus diaphanus]|nr:hypothetical protein C1646_771605 [Rhizophagus diaphanus] [Rhizophagus sp. MUCL 43196]